MSPRRSPAFRRRWPRGSGASGCRLERTLCETLQVSRSTLRRALTQLKREGAIRTEHGAGNQIVRRKMKSAKRLGSHDVAVLALPLCAGRAQVAPPVRSAAKDGLAVDTAQLLAFEASSALIRSRRLP